MIQWTDKSDSSSRFFVAEVDFGIDEEGLRKTLLVMLDQLAREIAGAENAADFDTAFLEVNLDTGRIIAAVSTEARRAKGHVDGCAIRSQALQDYWYDLDEAGLSDDAFTREVSTMVSKIGSTYRDLLRSEAARKFPQAETLQLIVYGSDPGVVILRERIVSA